MRKWALIATVALLAVGAGAQTGDIVTTDLNEVTPEQLGATLAGAGATITNVSYTGDPTAAGVFSGGISAGFPIESGVILSSGDIAEIIGPNDASGAGSALGTPGDADLNVLIDGNTNDAAILEFDVVTLTPDLVINYVFASEEYKEYVNSSFNDVFGFFVDGQNIAFVQGDPNQIVSINSINHLVNTDLYIDNPEDAPVANTQFDGFTVLITAVAQLTPGVPHHLKLAIADTSDSILDSAVIIQSGGITGGAPTVALQVTPAAVESLAAEVLEFDVKAYGLPPGDKANLAVTTVPEDWTVEIEPTVLVGPPIPEDGGARPIPTAKMTVVSPDDAFPKSYGIEVKASGKATIEGGDPEDEDAKIPFEAFDGARVDILCDPPIILGKPDDQPKSQTVAAGATATMSVTVSGGTQPYAYQWYFGPCCSTRFPILEGTESTYTTPPVNRVLQYWVRVSNGCGDRDSWTATIVPEGETAPVDERPSRSRGANRPGAPDGGGD